MAASVPASSAKPSCAAKRRGAQHAQRVLAEARFRVADAADDAAGEILPATEKVCDGSGQVHGHGVDGKIPAGQVVRETADEAHAVRVAAVVIGAVETVGRDLGAGTVQKDRHRAVLQPGGDAAGEQAQDVLRQRLRGDIPVMDRAAQQRVAHAPADVPRLKPGTLQRL